MLMMEGLYCDLKGVKSCTLERSSAEEVQVAVLNSASK